MAASALAIGAARAQTAAAPPQDQQAAAAVPQAQQAAAAPQDQQTAATAQAPQQRAVTQTAVPGVGSPAPQGTPAAGNASDNGATDTPRGNTTQPNIWYSDSTSPWNGSGEANVWYSNSTDPAANYGQSNIWYSNSTDPRTSYNQGGASWYSNSASPDPSRAGGFSEPPPPVWLTWSTSFASHPVSSTTTESLPAPGMYAAPPTGTNQPQSPPFGYLKSDTPVVNLNAPAPTAAQPNATGAGTATGAETTTGVATGAANGAPPPGAAPTPPTGGSPTAPAGTPPTGAAPAATGTTPTGAAPAPTGAAPTATGTAASNAPTPGVSVVVQAPPGAGVTVTEHGAAPAEAQGTSPSESENEGADNQAPSEAATARGMAHIPAAPSIAQTNPTSAHEETAPAHTNASESDHRLGGADTTGAAAANAAREEAHADQAAAPNTPTAASKTELSTVILKVAFVALLGLSLCVAATGIILAVAFGLKGGFSGRPQR